MSKSLQTSALLYLDSLLRRGQFSVGVREVAGEFGLSPQAASNLCTRLVRKGLLDRVVPGRFAIRQARPARNVSCR